MKDREFLRWIHDRLIKVHKEPPFADYMHKLRAVSESIDPGQETPNVCSNPESFGGEPHFFHKPKEQHMFKNYYKPAAQPMRPYVPGEGLTGISVSEQDTPEPGGMIARNPNNHDDQWYVAKKFFEDNYKLVEPD